MNNMHIFAFASIIAASSLMAGTLTTIVFAQGSTTEAYGAADSTVGITPSWNGSSSVENATSGATGDNPTVTTPIQ